MVCHALRTQSLDMVTLHPLSLGMVTMVRRLPPGCSTTLGCLCAGLWCSLPNRAASSKLVACATSLVNGSAAGLDTRQQVSHSPTLGGACALLLPCKAIRHILGVLPSKSCGAASAATSGRPLQSRLALRAWTWLDLNWQAKGAAVANRKQEGRRVY